MPLARAEALDMETADEDWLNEGCLPDVVVAGVALMIAIVIIVSFIPLTMESLLILVPIGALLTTFVLALGCVWMRRGDEHQ